MQRSLVALLPMKAHSSRVPRKNFRPLAGKPMARWMLDALLAMDEVDQVVINTDARQILADVGITETDRIVIRDRKDDLCGDLISMNLILEDDVAAVPAQQYLMTHTTNPLLTQETMSQAIAAYRQNPDCDSLFTVNRIQTRFYRADGSPVNHDPDNLVRTQDLEPWFEENSCLYLFTAESFAATGARIGQRPMMFETPPLESIDIDEQHQWEMAEALLDRRESAAAEVPA